MNRDEGNLRIQGSKYAIPLKFILLRCGSVTSWNTGTSATSSKKPRPSTEKKKLFSPGGTAAERNEPLFFREAANDLRGGYGLVFPGMPPILSGV